LAEDPLDHRPLENGGNESELAGAAVPTVLPVDVKDALAQLRPTLALRPGEDRPDLAFSGGSGYAGRFLVRW